MSRPPEQRAVTTRAPLSFEQKCTRCGHVRDTDLFMDGDTTSSDTVCDLCLRKAERIELGLHTPENSRVGAGREAHMRPAAFAAAELALLNDWRHVRREQLATDGILFGDAALIIDQETPQARVQLGLRSA